MQFMQKSADFFSVCVGQGIVLIDPTRLATFGPA